MAKPKNSIKFLSPNLGKIPPSFELRNAFVVFFTNLEGKNLIEIQNVASYVLELLRIFDPNLKKRPEKNLLIRHFVIQSSEEFRNSELGGFKTQLCAYSYTNGSAVASLK